MHWAVLMRDVILVSNHGNVCMMIATGIEMRLRKQASSFSDCCGSLDDSGHLKSSNKATRSSSVVTSSRSIDFVDPPLTTANSSSTDCVDSDQQVNGSTDHDIYNTNLKSACQVSVLLYETVCV